MPGGILVMKKKNAKLSLPISIGLLLFLLFTTYSFAQNPGNALDFDGSDDYVSIPDAAALDITDQITIEGWFKPSASSWAFKKLITIDSDSVAATQSNFPVLVSVTDVDLKDSDNGGPIQPDGDDILFKATDGTKLSHEIEEYDGSTGKLIAWVKIPSLSSSTDTEFYLYYGNTSCSSQQDVVNVRDTNFKGVWHLDEEMVDEDSTGTHIESTSNSFDGSQQGNEGVPGKFAGGQDFDGNNDCVDVSADDTGFLGALTISVWANIENASPDIHFAGKHLTNGIRNNPFEFRSEDGNGNSLILVRANANGLCVWEGPALTAGEWKQYAVVIHSSEISTAPTFYIDGVPSTGILYGGTGSGDVTGTDANIRIGAREGDHPNMDGIMDEVRISNVARSSSWIATEYANQNSPGTFMSISNQTAVGVSKSLAYGISTNNSKAYGTINDQTVSGDITASEWNHISLTYNKDAGTDEIKLYINGTQSASVAYSTAITTNNNNLLLGDMAGFIGKMDEVRIWNDVRTEQEIRDNMHRVVTAVSETNLVGYWNLNESSCVTSL